MAQTSTRKVKATSITTETVRVSPVKRKRGKKGAGDKEGFELVVWEGEDSCAAPSELSGSFAQTGMTKKKNG